MAVVALGFYFKVLVHIGLVFLQLNLILAILSVLHIFKLDSVITVIALRLHVII